jgi:hypothetical protein
MGKAFRSTSRAIERSSNAPPKPNKHHKQALSARFLGCRE